MSESGIVAQFAVLVAGDAVDFADGSEHLCLFDRVHAEVRFEVEVQVQHVSGIASLLHRQVENALLDGVRFWR